MRKIGFLTVWVVATCYSSVAHAQNTPFVIDNQPNYFALAAGVAPDYVGSDDVRAVVGPSGRLGFGKQRYVELVSEDISMTTAIQQGRLQR